jgi:SAM-dependent methyltransferase
MTSYFELRNISQEYYAQYTNPRWLRDQLSPIAADARILDFGCGFGQLITALKALGYSRAEGADVEPAAIAACRQHGDTVYDLRAEGRFYDLNQGQFDLVVTQHVLEHIPKSEVVETVRNLRLLLSPKGVLVVAVPNAQAFTGAYWAYEDFTHQTLYTSGGIYYVLRAAGFGDIRFLDIDCSSGLGLLKSAVRRIVWKVYSAYYNLMCRLLVSPTHGPSPNIFSYEIKVAARPL